MKDKKKVKESSEISSSSTLKELKENYKILTESVLEGIMILDFTGKVLFANKSAAKMFGYKKSEEGIGKNAFDFISTEHKDLVKKDLARVYGGEWGFLTNYKVVTKEGKEFWVETLGRKIKYHGKPADLTVLRDVTKRKEMEDALKKAKEELEIKVKERTSELQESCEKLQRLLKETVSALASAVEVKDPYTAGHQQRVAELACAIAKEMGFSEKQISGLEVAAIIHDIGKIHVPAEILTKPGGLTQDEINMINTHPQYGHDILKEIEFPWPVAEIVLQHHERMDGSGYPNKLSGKNILMEARVIGVADVVEAMSTRRPYRSALGLDKALEEISEKKGTVYDTKVAEACSRLFKEKRFKLTQEIK